MECNLNPMGVIHKVSNHESPRPQITGASFISTPPLPNLHKKLYFQISDLQQLKINATQILQFQKTPTIANPYICFLGISAI
jgi:hypothetical protein